MGFGLTAGLAIGLKGERDVSHDLVPIAREIRGFSNTHPANATEKRPKTGTRFWRANISLSDFVA